MLCIGLDDKTLIDCNLKVNGVNNLKIVDTSIMVHLFSGNTLSEI